MFITPDYRSTSVDWNNGKHVWSKIVMKSSGYHSSNIAAVIATCLLKLPYLLMTFSTPLWQRRRKKDEPRNQSDQACQASRWQMRDFHEYFECWLPVCTLSCLPSICFSWEYLGLPCSTFSVFVVKCNGKGNQLKWKKIHGLIDHTAKSERLILGIRIYNWFHKLWQTILRVADFNFLLSVLRWSKFISCHKIDIQ